MSALLAARSVSPPTVLMLCRAEGLSVEDQPADGLTYASGTDDPGEWGRSLPCMSPREPPLGEPAKLSLGHGDPTAAELIGAIHGGALGSVRHRLAERPELATVRMIGRQGMEGGWRTPLHVATDWPGYFPAAPAVVALLLEAGADPNEDSGGDRPETPLHWAASTDDVDVAAVLINAGADLETPGGSIGTPLDNAIGYGCWHVARLLVASGARVDKLWHAAALGALSRLEELMADGADHDEVSQAFWHACSAAQRRAADYLLSQGAELNWVPDYADGTPRDAAGDSGTRRENVVSWLRELGGHTSQANEQHEPA
jgi:hypothetical protein